VDLALRLGHRLLIVDLAARDAADADLLSVLHRSGQRARDAGGRLAVVCADSRLRRLFDVTLLSQSLPVFETREEALAG
jgi:anti-anti-sigma regulatory factor